MPLPIGYGTLVAENLLAVPLDALKDIGEPVEEI